MKDDGINISVIGGKKARKAYDLLILRYKNVSYFSDETLFIPQSKCVPHILILEESCESNKILKQVKSISYVKTVYLSNNRTFSHFLKIVNEGVTDYIVKDSYLYFSIQQSINKITELKGFINLPFTKKYFLDTWSFKKRYPFRFMIAKLFLLVDTNYIRKMA